MKRDSVWGKYNGVDIENLEKLNKRYIDFLSQCKTERECVEESVAMAKKAGYVSLEEVIENGKPLKPGDKIYGVYMNKAIDFISRL